MAVDPNGWRTADDIWRLWNVLPDGLASPVKIVAAVLGLPTDVVAAVVYPIEQGFGPWADNGEPDWPPTS